MQSSSLCALGFLIMAQKYLIPVCTKENEFLEVFYSPLFVLTVYLSS